MLRVYWQDLYTPQRYASSNELGNYNSNRYYNSCFTPLQARFNRITLSGGYENGIWEIVT